MAGSFITCIRVVLPFFILLYAHLLRGLLYGSYKKPRELVWLGVLLYLLSLSEAFLGYLLPWGQMSYWASQVATSAVGTFPFFGETLYIASGYQHYLFFWSASISLPYVQSGQLAHKEPLHRHAHHFRPLIFRFILTTPAKIYSPWPSVYLFFR